MRILIIGGYGTFGGRLVDLLSDEPRLTLMVAGRNLQRAKTFCAARGSAAATLVPVQFDRGAPGALAVLRPNIVVDATGPFQGYGDDPYAIVRAALGAGADWLDLADSLGFVTGIGKLDALAKQKERFVLAGASSFPVLSAAVVRRLAADMAIVERIEGGIAPSPYAGVGLNVIRAIASYAGKPIQLRDGTSFGLTSSRRMTVNVPGLVPLWPIRFALVEVPDLVVLAEDWPDAKIWMGAGPRPALLHRLLWLAAWLVRLRILPSLVPLAPVMDWVVNHIRWGEHRGGMIMRVTGRSAGVRKALTWNLIADGAAGPLIPSMAVEAIIRRVLDGQRPEPGARSAHHALELEDYEALFAKRGIETAVRDAGPPPGPYHDVLPLLPPALAEVHGFTQSIALSGVAQIEGAATGLGSWIAQLFGFPVAGGDVPVEVTMTRDGQRERWERRFAGVPMVSTQEPGRGRYEGLLVERFGLTAFGMAIVVAGGQLSLVMRRWSVLGLPMPRWSMPGVSAIEHARDGVFHFAVEIGLPVVGRLVRYEGWLRPVEARQEREGRDREIPPQSD